MWVHVRSICRSAAFTSGRVPTGCTKTTKRVTQIFKSNTAKCGFFLHSLASPAECDRKGVKHADLAKFDGTYFLPYYKPFSCFGRFQATVEFHVDSWELCG